jgi:DNA-binding HxlR family transcriptional regulator
MAHTKNIIGRDGSELCPVEFIRAIDDTLDFLRGKWKLHIIGCLMSGKKRFGEIERSIPNINPRMLSKELRDLEMNKMVKRTVYDTMPPAVEYEITSYGRSLDKVLFEMRDWGIQHRKKIIGK